jgi:glycosyltransferase involved in cell wall biosynthesis
MSNSLNVLFVHQSSELYGSDRVLLMLVIALRQHGEFQPVVLLPDHGPLFDELIRAGIEVHTGCVAKISRAMFTPLGVFKTLKALKTGAKDIDRVMAGRKVALVHSNTIAVLSGAVWAWRHKVLHLWHVHEIVLSPRLVSSFLPRLVHWLSDGVIANSRPTQSWLLETATGLKKKCRVIFNGLPPVVAAQSSLVQVFRQNLGANENDVVVSLVGRINLLKGQEIFIEAIGLLKARGVLGAARFAIVGSPAPGLDHLVAQLQDRIKALELSSVVSFVSFDADVWPIWFGSDIAVVPSTEPESFGMVAIEAMGASLPVIASAHGGLLDIVENEKTGLLVAPRSSQALADAMQRLMVSSELRQSMGHAGFQRQAQHFSLDAQVQQTMAMYRDFIQARDEVSRTNRLS